MLKTLPKKISKSALQKGVQENLRFFKVLTFKNKIRITKHYFVSLLSFVGNTLYTIFTSNKYLKFLIIPFLLAFKSLVVYKWFRITLFIILGLQIIYNNYDLNFIIELWLFIISSYEYDQIVNALKEIKYYFFPSSRPRTSWFFKPASTANHSLSEIEKSSLLEFTWSKNVYIERPWYHKKRCVIPIVLLFLFGGKKHN